MSRPSIRPAGVPAALIPIAWIVGGAIALWVVFGHGFVQYDSFYALVWGDEIAHGQQPDYGAPLSPTPHPLATAVGVVLSPLGDGAEIAMLAIAFLALAAVAYLVYRLGAAWFNRWVGLLAAAIMITRQPLLDFGVRAYVDIPYLALLLTALLVETRRPRCGAPVLALLAVAGLLRPEAWLFSAAYVVWLAYGDPQRPRGSRLAPLVAFLRDRDHFGLIALAAAAPVLWIAYDLLVTGDPLYSLTGTRETVEALGRDTGLRGLVIEGPQRLGEVLREPVLLGALCGVVLTAIALRRRAAIAIAAALLAFAAFSILALAGLAVLTRYLLPAAAILVILCAAAVLGWLELDRDDPWRRRWAAVGAVVALLLVVFVPSQVDRLSDLQDSIALQEQLTDDLHDLADSGAFDAACGPITVPDERAIPFLALWLDRDPSAIEPTEETAPAPADGSPTGYFVIARTQNAKNFFTLVPGEGARERVFIPKGTPRVASNDSWELYADCATGDER